jgi:hypothetical protein
VVQPFAQAHMDQRHPVDGMLGMEVLELFDVDLDFPADRIRAGMVEIPTAQVGFGLGSKGFEYGLLPVRHNPFPGLY